MNPEPNIDELPEEWKAAFRALGGVQAPAELADRVALARMEKVEAPAELRHRVELAAFGQVSAPAELGEIVEAEVRRLARPVLPFRVTLPRAAAAAVLLGIGIVFGPWSASKPTGVSQSHEQVVADYAQMREAAKRKIALVAQPIDDLDPAARSLAVNFGGMLDEEGAQ